MPFSRRGFTLVELLVVIAILAVLTVIATATFTNLRKGANDARRKADIEAIAKAYELKYSGSYQTLADNNFVSGKIPVPPQGGAYTTVYQDGGGFKVCAALENNLNSGIASCGDTRPDYCYCISSLQGAAASSGSGGYVSHPYICDTTGSLGLGLVGYWKMDEVAGSTTAADSSGNGNNGTYTNGATTATRNPPQTNNATTGLFDGVNDYVSAGTSVGSKYTNAFTVAGWIYLNAGGLRGFIYNGNGTEAGTGGFYIRSVNSNDGNKVQLVVGNGAARNLTAFNYVLDPITNAWHYLTFVVDGTNKILYVDGIQRDSIALGISGPFTSYQDFRIGTGYGGDQEFLNGLIDDVRIYNKALSPTEVQNLYGPGGAGCIP